MKKTRKIISCFEMILIIGMVFSFCYFIKENDNSYEKTLDEIFGKTSASAFDLSSLSSLGGLGNLGISPQQIMGGMSETIGGGMSVCIESKYGEKCQKSSNKECEASCLPGKCVEFAKINSVSQENWPDECELGTCYDKEYGTCSPNAPKWECVGDNVTWFDDPNANVPECLQGCCVIGTEAMLITEGQCKTYAQSKGIEYPTTNAKFDSSLNSEPACLMNARREAEGACIYGEIEGTGGKKECEINIKQECLTKRGSFYKGVLCSNSSLSTICTAKNYTSCVDGLEEVYWFDSCGNKENIYGSEVAGKEGMILLKKESCVIGEPGDWLKNQGTCGNCNRLVGSVCGNKTASEKLDDSKQEVVCKDLGCVEKLSGGTEVRRENGESWCDYQSNFGLFPADIPGLGILNYIGGFGGFGFIGVHSVGPPGSQFFKRTCINGEISLETCAPYRNDICAEQREDVNGAGKTVSSATCRANRWAECLKYNPDEKLPGILGQMKVYQAMAKCEVDPDCFVKTVNVGSNFKFPVCVPKYPAGFVFDQGNGGSGDGVCKFASQECVAMFVKEAKAMGLGGAKWECKSNCECVDNKNDPDSAGPSQAFTSQMHDLCVSLGDCGSKMNYMGMLGRGGYETGSCTTKNPDDDCKKKGGGLGLMGGFSWKSMLSKFISMPAGFGSMADWMKPGREKYIPINTEGLHNSIGKSTGNPLPSDYADTGAGETGEGASYAGQGMVKAPEAKIYQGKELLWVAGISGITGSGMMIAMQTGLIPATTAVGAGAASTAVAPSIMVPLEGGLEPTLQVVPFDASGIAPTLEVPGVSGVVPAAWPAEGGGMTMIPSEASVLPSTATLEPVGMAADGSLVPIDASGAASLYGPSSSLTPTAPVISSAQTAGTVGLGAVSGAAIGLATTSLGIQLTGIGPGLGKAGSYGLMAMGAGAGASFGGAYAISAQGASIMSAKVVTEAGWTWISQTLPLFRGLMWGGYILTAVVVTLTVLNWLMGVGETKYVHVWFECKPWEPPMGGAACGKCGSDGYPCNLYACSALGGTCVLMGDESNAICVDSSPNDVTGPKISEWQEALKTGFEMSDISETGYKVRKVGDVKCIEQFESMSFGILTDEYARCKLSPVADAEYDNMADFGSGNLLKNHTHIINSLEILNYFEMKGEALQPEEERDINLYVKCNDIKDNPSRGTYAINLCVKLIDTTAPFLQDIGLGGNYLPYDATSGDIGVQSNEPVEMRWSYEDKDFDLMENTFTCQNSSSLMDCLANIPIQGEVTTIYVRAKDHPEWKGTDRENQRNKNQQSIVIVIKKTKDRLVVDYAKPNNETFTVNTPIASINLEAGTSGGIDGSADCSFSIDRESFVEFRETGGKTHKQVIERSNEGMHGVNVSCTDKAGNKASRYITFTLKKDLIPPTIARMYRQFGKLVLVINEPGRCAYLNEVLEGKTNPCGFEFEQGVEMSGESGGYAQMADFDETKTYYIKCKDTLGNIKPGEECGAIIRGGQL